ncbi:MAG: hypothetical protein NC833_03535 [Candidatus Omnitrophica bacterium]|nr:hypothetical protein [Candidatus Omnitrophota bacterium]
MVAYLSVLKHKITYKLTYRIQCAKIMELDEQDFRKIVYEIEESPLFEKFKKYGIIKIQKFPHIKFHSSYYKLEEERTSYNEKFNIDSFLFGKEKIIYLAQKLGKEKFNRYFLQGNFSNIREIAEESGLSIDEVKEIANFMEDFFLQKEFSNSIPEVVSGKKLTIIAEIKRYGKRYEVKFSQPNYFKEKYLINYSKLEEFKIKKMDRKEKKQINEFIKQLKVINMRKNLLYQILKTIASEQNKYFRTGRLYDLKPLTLRELSRKLNANPSYVCRLIRGKAIKLPSGEEKELKFFLPNRKKVVKEYMKNFLMIEKNRVSARELKDEIEKKFEFKIPLRTVSYYLKEIKNV